MRKQLIFTWTVSLGPAALGLISILLIFISVSAPAQSDRPIPPRLTNDIKVVYQIKTDDWKEGVGSGLFYVNKLMGLYQELDVPKNQIHVYAVLHGDAAYWLLNDATYGKISDKKTGNPNKRLIERLLKMGVSLEICWQTMQKHGWKPEDLLPGVKVVYAAYARIIDLQLRGCAYIRF